MVLRTPVARLIIFLCIILQCFWHEIMSPTFHNCLIPFGPFLFYTYTSITVFHTIIIFLDQETSMVDNKFTFLTYPSYPPHFHLIYLVFGRYYRCLEHHIYILTFVYSCSGSRGLQGYWQTPPLHMYISLISIMFYWFWNLRNTSP